MEPPKAFAFEVIQSMSAKRPEPRVIHEGEIPSTITVRLLLESGQAIARDKGGPIDQSAVFQLVRGYTLMLSPSMYGKLLPDVCLEGHEKFVVLVKPVEDEADGAPVAVS
ncbi:hypothetical protein WJX72_004034 [[Myrmecia] bisecta]|uniref:Uncharacterized protein n=1 Tax=[Myrmecia] bisecta TaxID=41462 RepID=A0AAW1R5M2_9CHLO